MRVAVIDVGNTSTAIGLWSDGAVSRVSHIDGGVRARSEDCAAALRKAARGGIDGAMLASVVPAVNAAWKRLVRRELGCDLPRVSCDRPMDVSIDYPEPRTIGDDRLADACGGVRRYGAPLIIADFGTALTFDVVTRDRRYIGGAITPGLPLMTDYLYERTAQLPRVTLKGECPSIGRSTMEAMRIGAQIGYQGIVREITSYLRRSQRERFRLVATGGYAGWALAGSGLAYTVDPTLTLYGIGCIYEKGAKK